MFHIVQTIGSQLTALTTMLQHAPFVLQEFKENAESGVRLAPA
jgi:hypothetical protein